MYLTAPQHEKIIVFRCSFFIKMNEGLSLTVYSMLIPSFDILPCLISVAESAGVCARPILGHAALIDAAARMFAQPGWHRRNRRGCLLSRRKRREKPGRRKEGNQSCHLTCTSILRIKTAKWMHDCACGQLLRPSIRACWEGN
uniref:Uncharacterized protein n=1 Tax=Steinernema glaseri TaxID=37863 RepID=A0A1I8A3P2_9BILA